MQQYNFIIMIQYIGSDACCIDTHLNHISISNIVIPISMYHYVYDIQTVYLYIQYFMTDAVYYGYQFYSIVLIESCNFGKKFCPSVKIS